MTYHLEKSALARLYFPHLPPHQVRIIFRPYTDLP